MTNTQIIEAFRNTVLTPNPNGNQDDREVLIRVPGDGYYYVREVTVPNPGTKIVLELGGKSPYEERRG